MNASPLGSTFASDSAAPFRKTFHHVFSLSELTKHPDLPDPSSRHRLNGESSLSIQHQRGYSSPSNSYCTAG